MLVLVLLVLLRNLHTGLLVELHTGLHIRLQPGLRTVAPCRSDSTSNSTCFVCPHNAQAEAKFSFAAHSSHCDCAAGGARSFVAGRGPLGTCVHRPMFLPSAKRRLAWAAITAARTSRWRDTSGTRNKRRKSWYGRKIRSRTSAVSSRSERTDDEAVSAGLGAQS